MKYPVIQIQIPTMRIHTFYLGFFSTTKIKHKLLKIYILFQSHANIIYTFIKSCIENVTLITLVSQSNYNKVPKYITNIHVF
jgi:hypothetical protein